MKTKIQPRTYSEEEKKHLEAVKLAFQNAYTEAIADPKLEMTAYSDHNAVINLTKAMASGEDFYMPKVNRTHGRDKDRTGKSICQDGAQALLLVIPASVAKIAGMEYVRYATDSKKDTPVGDTGFVCINGNGRMEYLLSLEAKGRPILYATFIEPNKDDYYDIPAAMGAINEHQSQWKTQDKMSKKIIEMGEAVNQYLMTTRLLVNEGYNYQAACQLTTLRPDRITSVQLEAADWGEIFKYGEEATRVREKLFEIFGRSSRILKTKPFSQKICKIFDELLKVKKNSTEACDFVIEFLTEIEVAQIQKIKDCKNDKDNPANSADSKRVEILNNLFNRFVGKKGLNID